MPPANVSSWPAFAANRFEVFATGGSCFDANETPSSNFVCFSIVGSQLISTSSGAFLTTGGHWQDASDRNAKRDFLAIHPQSVLERVVALPLSEWSYRAEDPKVRHVGPMAQDFYAAFHLGFDDKHIGTIDESGVALAAIQGLNQELEEKIRQKEAQIAAMQKQMETLMLRVAAVEKGNSEAAPRRTEFPADGE